MYVVDYLWGVAHVLRLPTELQLLPEITVINHHAKQLCNM